MDHLSTPRDFREDAALVRQAQQGDAEAFARVAAAYRGLVLAKIQPYCQADDVDDLLQEVLAQAWDKLSTLRDAQAFPAWLTRLAANCGRRWRERRARRQHLPFDDAYLHPATAAPDPLECYLRHEQSQQLRQALLDLPGENRRALIMAVWGQYSYAEIADRLQLPVTTVEGRIHRAKQQLRRALGYPLPARPVGRTLRGRRKPMDTPSMPPAPGGQPQLLPQLGHSSAVELLAISPDGRRLLSGAGTSCAILWDLATREELLHLEPGAFPIAMGFSGDGSLVALSGWSGDTRVWDVWHGVQVCTLPIETRRLTFGEDNRHLWTTGWAPDPEKAHWMRANVFCWDLESRQIVQRVEHLAGVPVALRQDARLLVTVTGDPSYEHALFVRLREVELIVWDLPEGRERCRLRGLPGYPHAIALSQHGTRLAAATLDPETPHDVWVWETRTGEEVQRLTGFAHPVASLTCTPDGAQLIAGTKGGEISRWSLADGRRLGVRQTGGTIGAITVTADDACALFAAPEEQTLYFRSGTIAQWDLAEDTLTRPFTQHVCGQSTEAVSPDGGLLATGGFGADITLWDLREGQLARTIHGPEDAFIHTLACHPRKPLLLGSMNILPHPAAQPEEFTGTIGLWSLATGERLRTLTAHRQSIYNVIFTADGSRMASSSFDGTVVLWETAQWEMLRRLTFPEGWRSGMGLAFSPDGARLAANSALYSPHRALVRGALTIWDTATGATVRHWEKGELDIQAPLFSRDGSTLLVTTMQRIGRLEPAEVAVWDIVGGEEIHRYTAPGVLGQFGRIAWSPDGRLLVGVTNGVVACWEAGGTTPLRLLRQHAGFANLLAFTPDGRLLITGGVEGKIHLWQVEEIYAGDTPHPAVTLVALDRSAAWLAYTPEGDYTGSPGVDAYLRWRTDGTLHPVPASHHRPALFHELLR